MATTCRETIEKQNHMIGGGFEYYICGKPVKYKISLLNPINGKNIEYSLCGIHFKAAQKNASRILRKTGFDTKFSFEKI